MLTDQLNDWKTQAEAAEILKCSEKTVGRMAAQKKIERVLRRVPGRKPMPFSIQTTSRRSALRRRNPNRSRLESG